jgi:hypothetical protein
MVELIRRFSPSEEDSMENWAYPIKLIG